jgi:hypothetical protein
MIKNARLVSEFEDELAAREPRLSYHEALALYEAMWRHAVELGAFPFSNPLEGIEIDIRVARIANSCSTKPLF